MKKISLRVVTTACIIGYASFSFLLTPVYAENLLEGGSDYTDRDAGVILSIPKQWQAKSTDRETLSGDASQHVQVLQKYENKTSRVSASVDVSVSTLAGVLGLPNRLRSKISDADIANAYIDQALRTRNTYMVRGVRREMVGDTNAFVIESSEKTNDRYTAYSTDYLIFRKNRVYLIEVWYLAHQKDKKPFLAVIVSSLKFLNT